MSFDNLGDRMKGYEHASRITLPRRMPVIIRVDGKAFHMLTRICRKPFDARLMAAMDAVAIGLCQEVQGAQVAYVQSDEVSVLVHNYKRLNTDAWFDNGLQKMVSVAASIASTQFNRTFDHMAGAHFDARAFVLPEAEVCNYFVWRQQDASRNSIQMLARSLYSHRECENKNTSDLQEMCFRRGANWNDLPTSQRRGRCATPVFFDGVRSGWCVDSEIPIFTQDRAYIEHHLAVFPEETRAETAHVNDMRVGQ